MLELDPAVALALVLSVASTALCIAYGLTHWNADDDAGEDRPDWAPTRSDSGRAEEKDLV